MYEEKLKKIGLTDGEARVYSVLIRLGSSTVGPIAKKSNVAYSKIYEVLQRLAEKGLVSFIVKEKTRYFQALAPSRLNEYIERQLNEIKESQNIVNEIIPGLNEMVTSSQKEEAKVFVGEKGIMTAYDILLKEAKENSELRFFHMHNPKLDEKVYNFYYGRVNYNNKVIQPHLNKKKIKWMGIVNRENMGKKLGVPPKNIEQRYVKFPVPGSIDITDGAILITIWSPAKPLGILIQSEEVAQSFKDYFDSVWIVAKR